MNDLDDSTLSGAAYRVLYQIAERATSGESLHAFVQALHHMLAELMPVQNLYLCLVNAHADGLNFPYYVDERDGDSMQEADVPMRRGLTEFVLRTQASQLIDQTRYAALQNLGEITEATGDLSFCSWLGVPLRIRGEVSGVLTVQSYDPTVFYGPAEVQLLAFVARHVSTAIERKQSFDALKAAHAELEQETRQRRQSEAMYRVFYQLAASASEGGTLHAFSAKVHGLLGQLMEASNCYICLCDTGRQLKHFPYYVDERDGDTLQLENVPMRLGLTEFVVSTGLPQRIDQARLQQLQQQGLVTQAQGDLSFSAWLGVPLNVRGTVDGVLAVQSYQPEAVYSEADAQVLAHVAHHVSGAIERKQAFEAMHQSEERYRNVVEQVGQGMMVLHGHSVLYANRQAAAMLGVSAAELSEQGWTGNMHPQDRAQMLADFSSANPLQAAGPAREFELLMDDGDSRWIEMGATRVQWDGLPSTLAFLSDITQRKQLELALRRTSFEREAMLNTALVGISFNVRGRIVWVNAKCAEMSGMRREQLMGQSPRIFYASDEEYEVERQRTDAALRADGVFSAERRSFSHNGASLWVLVAGRCVEGKDPDAGVIWTLLDVTERRRAEDDIRQTLERQRELNVLRSRFVAMTSHEFRTPLASIFSSAELLRHYEDRLPVGERRELLLSIESAVQRMEQMLNRILLIGKAEADMLEFRPQRRDLRALCERFVRDARQQYPRAPSTLELVWELAQPEVLCDEKLLGHMLSNLLSNALKYSPEGGVVCLRVGPHPEGLALGVQDQGIGIPENEQADLFGSFQRASNVGDIEGTGLGLSIVKKSVELHGGRVQVQSQPGQGTLVQIFLPLAGDSA
jgi:PAS domain S-box-containing protein